MQKASDGQRWPGACQRTASGMADSLVAVITLVSNKPGTQAPTACLLTLEERIGAREFLETVGGELERGKREDEGSEPKRQP